MDDNGEDRSEAQSSQPTETEEQPQNGEEETKDEPAPESHGHKSSEAPDQNEFDPYAFYQNPSYPPYMHPYNMPGQGSATACMVLGILSVLCWFIDIDSIFVPVASVVFGLFVILFSGGSKSKGYFGALRTAGLILSVVG
ncbi:MAG: hypothetical protein LUB61_03195, partial [Eggerthellaceae bacterium]|nr:hypothetical protein [Eggerthellaceae bacterium]